MQDGGPNVTCSVRIADTSTALTQENRYMCTPLCRWCEWDVKFGPWVPHSEHIIHMYICHWRHWLWYLGKSLYGTPLDRPLSGKSGVCAIFAICVPICLSGVSELLSLDNGFRTRVIARAVGFMSQIMRGTLLVAVILTCFYGGCWSLTNEWTDHHDDAMYAFQIVAHALDMHTLHRYEIRSHDINISIPICIVRVSNSA